jgi:hypothetical protein
MAHVNLRVSLDISADEHRRLFLEYLDILKDGRWILDGQLMHEVVTSHSFDVSEGDATHPDFRLVSLIQDLQKELEARKGKPR